MRFWILQPEEVAHACRERLREEQSRRTALKCSVRKFLDANYATDA
jgi:hypothetical protein